MKSRPYSAVAFDEWLAFAQRWTARAGKNIRLQRTPAGIVISAETADAWEHPWTLRCHPVPIPDDPDGRVEWRARVKPGFVNGRDATIEQTIIDDRKKPMTVETPLSDDPAPELLLDAWRNPLLSAGLVATDAGELLALPGERIPRFLQNLGVKPTAAGGDPLGGGDAIPADDFHSRKLRALDVVLVVPRIAAATDVQIQNPLTDAQFVSLTSRFIDDYARTATSDARLVTRSKWSPPLEPDALDFLLGTAVEPQTDELKIATVWLVSPPGAAEDDVPDGTWTAYPEYSVFWNVMHQPRRLASEVNRDPITLTTGLLFGIGDALFKGLLAPVNDANSETASFLTLQSLRGSFWTT